MEEVVRKGESFSMKMAIDIDEWYPVYTIHKRRIMGCVDVDIPQELVERFDKVSYEFSVIQSELRQLYQAAKTPV